MKDNEYGNRLKEFLYEQSYLPFEIVSFSSLEAIYGYEKKKNIGLLLTDTQFKESIVENIPIVAFVESLQLEKDYEKFAIFKYQPIENIIGKIIEIYKQLTKEQTFQKSIHHETTLIGVYSPIGRCLKTSFSLTLGQLLSKKQSVLYITLESISGLNYLLDREYSFDLSDIIFSFHEKSLEKRMDTMIDTFDQLHYIPPVKCPEDLKEITAEEFIGALQVIVRKSKYSTVIIDIGEGFGQPATLLSLCNIIYMPIKEDVMSECKIRAFEQLLHSINKEHILAKIQKLQLPYNHCFGGKQTYLDQLLWGELGDYTRNLIKG